MKLEWILSSSMYRVVCVLSVNIRPIRGGASKIFFFVILAVLALSDSANILGLMNAPSPSHYVWSHVLMSRLAEAGHNVTILSMDIPKASEDVHPNLHYIHLEEGYCMYNGETNVDLRDYMNLDPFKAILLLNAFGALSTKCVAKSKGLQVLLNYPDNFKFDLIIHDYTTSPSLLGFVHKFKYPPLVGITSFHTPPNTMDLMSNHYFPAYVPLYLMEYASEMNFWQRFHNTLVCIAETAYRRLVYLPEIDAIMRPYFAKDTPYLPNLWKYTAIALVNSHPALDYVEPLPPNIIEVGGMHILDPEPLPNDLEVFMNASRQGAVFFSFGTNMKSEYYSDKQLRVIIGAMTQLPEYNFLWAFNPGLIKEKLPKNILVRSFFPQRDVFAHQKLKAFVTHCGGLSAQEAVWRGVPMVGVPLFFDQKRNCRQVIQAGVAVTLDFQTMTTNDLRDAIKRVIHDPQIQVNIKTKSIQFRDRPAHPLHTAVWWVEYLLRNPNPYHLKSPAAKLNIFQANSLDCLLVLWTAVVLLIWLTVKLISVVCGTFCQKTNAVKLKRN